MQILCKYLDKDRFEVYACSPRDSVPPHRNLLDQIRSLLGSEKARARLEQNKFAHARAPEFIRLLGARNVCLYPEGDFSRWVREIAPHILHVHHSGQNTFSDKQVIALRSVPLLFTINVFGYKDESEFHKRIDKILFPSHWLKETVALWSQGDPRCDVLYCPVEKPFTDQNLRQDLGIGEDIFVLGRAGRNANDIHDSISLKAYKEIETEQTLFLALSAPPVMKKEAADLGIKNIRFLDPTVDDIFLSKFYNTTDALAHARLDGETFGCVIAEAMMHGKPVVTHLSSQRNAQAELVDKTCGFVARQGDWEEYARYLQVLRENKDLRTRMGLAAKEKAETNFEAGLVAKKLEFLYLQELEKKEIRF
ncbi:MAG: glycosyltransferase family 4 protein [Elusimicrobia bacterium]|nr:glycosyltransferase family 4 protein [Elusimicrobiota bacterium]